jgi:hypothetical protein
MQGKVNELELDHHFWRAISTNAIFRNWFLAHTKFVDRTVSLVTDEKWHQRWYKDPHTKKDSETDILLMLRETASDERYAIHIENKPDHGRWEEKQAENYRKRALNRMSAWRYVDFQTALIAPRSLIARSSLEVSHFDLVMPYENIAAFVPEFLVA